MSTLPSSPSIRHSLDDWWATPPRLPIWIGWRLRTLVLAMLLGCATIFLIAQWLTTQPKLPMSLRATPEGLVSLQTVDYPPLQKLEGRVLLGMRFDLIDEQGHPDVVTIPVTSLSLQRSGRWLIDPQQRWQHGQAHMALEPVLRAWSPAGLSVHLQLNHAPEETVMLAPRGWTGLSPLFWMLSVLALTVYAVGAVVVLAGPQWRNVAYAILAFSQAMALMLMAIEANTALFAPWWLVQLDTSLRVMLDLTCAAALVQIAVLHPHRLPYWPWFAIAAWLLAVGAGATWGTLAAESDWWAIQGSSTSLTMASLALMWWGHRQTPHPFRLVLGRFVLLTVLTWLLLTLAIWLGGIRPDMQLNIATFGVMTWHVFTATQVILSPYLSRSKPLLQEFSLLAASSTVAASLDLLFVAVFSLGQFASMTLSLFLSFGVYLLVRRWLLNRLPGGESITMERLFQRLYRIAREVEQRPDALDTALVRLMRELFDPLEVSLVPGELTHAALRGNGSVLLVPVLRSGSQQDGHHQVMALRHSHKGRRLFTSEDARLAERVMEQLCRALRFDQAVEQGRSEERLRIAQDLHDDIGARLLTLMYQAPNAEIEEYIRHTIQDLKTLTRGLAAQSHGLTEAAGEWKRDISQRLSLARCELDWRMSLDEDLPLSMVQWSALTRILRELVSNAISHAKAKQVQVNLKLERDCLTLSVSDNGVGHEPETWSHGLGLGGVRKRVKQLGGTVSWHNAEPKGIRCDVVVAHFSADSQLSH